RLTCRAGLACRPNTGEAPASEYRARTSPAARCAVVCASSFNLGWSMRKPRLLGIFLLAAALLMFTGAESAVARSADDNDASVPPEWKNQIIADLEHNKRYLSRTRTRGKSGVVRFEFNMSRSRWVLPGTRIVTINPEPRPGGAPPHSAVAAVFAAATCQ